MWICIITPEIVGPHKNGGIGTHCYYLAQLLSRELRAKVTLLYTGNIETGDESYWKGWFERELGIAFEWLPPPADVPSQQPQLGFHYEKVARAVYHRLRGRDFDLCYFQEMLGNGFRCFQAKRTGQAFMNTLLTCTLHSCWEWVNQAMNRLPEYGLDELQTKFMERYCMEQADVVISPSRYMLDWAGKNGVRLPPRRWVLPNLFDPGLRPVGFRPPRQHVIFFGRLEVRKGLLLLLEALEILGKTADRAPTPLTVTFLGKPGYTPEGGGLASIESFRSRLPAVFSLTTQTDLNHHQALAFLAEHNDALVVCPSLIENAPYAVIESLQLGLNLIASNTGGTPELFGDPARLFDPQPAALARIMARGLRHDLPPVKPAMDLPRAKQLWGDFFGEIAAGTCPIAPSRPSPQTQPVTVYLASSSQVKLDTRRMLRWLEQQTYRPFSVVLIDEDIPDNYRQTGRPFPVTALDRDAAGPVIPHSAVAPGGGGYSVFLLPQAEPAPALLAELVAGMERSGCGALTCWMELTPPAETSVPVPRPHLFAPLGACLEAGLFGNTFGGGCLIVQDRLTPPTRASLRSLMELGQSWNQIAEWIVQGESFEVVPHELLRLHAGLESFLLPQTNYPRQMEIIRQYTQGLPDWVSRCLVHALGAERVRGQQSAARSAPKPPPLAKWWSRLKRRFPRLGRSTCQK